MFEGVDWVSVYSYGMVAIASIGAGVSAWYASRSFYTSRADAKRARENEALNYLSAFNPGNLTLWSGAVKTTPEWYRLQGEISKLVSYRGDVPKSFKQEFDLVCEYFSTDEAPSDPRLKDGMKVLQELKKKAHDEMRKR